MGWFNYWGLAIMAVIVAPNIVYYAMHKNDPATDFKNQKVEIAEQIGRYGCFALMIFNIPRTYFGFWFGHALTVYLCVNAGLCAAYLIFWIICRGGGSLLGAVSLSVLPTCVFLFSGVCLANIPLLSFALLFGATHIYISCKSAIEARKKKGARRKKRTRRDKVVDEVLLIFVLILFAFAVVGALSNGF